jgi:alpha-amylase
VLQRQSRVFEYEIIITKRISLREGASTLDVDYLIEGLPTDRTLHFAIEWNFAGMPAAADGRYFYDPNQQRLGDLGNRLDLRDATGIGLIDEWLGLDVGLSCNCPTNFWTFPIATVSQSESGFEAVHQSVVVMPHWLIQGDPQGHWGVSMRLSIDTNLTPSQLDSDHEIATAR